MNHFKFHSYFLNMPEVDQSVRQKFGREYGVLSMSLILLFTLAPVSSVAQDSGAVLEEVIVTATKRSENLQDIPLAITSLSSDRLRQQNVSNLKGLTSLVPNLDVAHNNGRMKIFIRGIGKTLDNSGSEGSIAVHQDDVVIAYPVIQGTSYHDVERIEVLRGPQGTLFGRNATGGAVNIITRGPSEEFRMDRGERYWPADQFRQHPHQDRSQLAAPVAGGEGGVDGRKYDRARCRLGNSPIKSHRPYSSSQGKSGSACSDFMYLSSSNTRSSFMI